MYEFVWVAIFCPSDTERIILGIFTSREKAVEAVERAAKDCDEYLEEDWRANYFINSYSDEQLTKPIGYYYISSYELR